MSGQLAVVGSGDIREEEDVAAENRPKGGGGGPDLYLNSVICRFKCDTFDHAAGQAKIRQFPVAQSTKFIQRFAVGAIGLELLHYAVQS